MTNSPLACVGGSPRHRPTVDGLQDATAGCIRKKDGWLAGNTDSRARRLCGTRVFFPPATHWVVRARGAHSVCDGCGPPFSRLVASSLGAVTGRRRHVLNFAEVAFCRGMTVRVTTFFHP